MSTMCSNVGKLIKGVGFDSRKPTGAMRDELDDILGDLLDEGPPKRKTQPPARDRQKKQSIEDFYSGLAAAAGDDSDTDVSAADMSQVTKSLAGLDDMDAELFDGKIKRKTSEKGGSKPSSPRKPVTPRSTGARSVSPLHRVNSPTRVASPTRSNTPTSPPSTARPTSTRRLTSKTSLEGKPNTAPGKFTDLGTQSESLKPGDVSAKQDRPGTVPKLKDKYHHYEEMELDELLASLSDEDEAPLSKKKIAKKLSGESRRRLDDFGGDGEKVKEQKREEFNMPAQLQDRDMLSPRTRSLYERPPTRSGVQTTASEPPATAEHVQPPKPKSAPIRKRDDLVFSDDEDILGGMGLNEKVATKQKEKPKVDEDEDAKKPARSALDSLIGKDTVNKHLERPSSRERMEEIFEKKLSNLATENKKEEENFNFGSYMPSVASERGVPSVASERGSRPTSRRSVRFEGDEETTDISPTRSVKSSKQEELDSAERLKLTLTEKVPPKPVAAPQPKKPEPVVLTEPAKSKVDPYDWLEIKEPAEEYTMTPSSPPPKKVETKKPEVEEDDWMISRRKLKSSPAWLGQREEKTKASDAQISALLTGEPESPKFQRKEIEDPFSMPVQRDARPRWEVDDRQNQNAEQPRLPGTPAKSTPGRLGLEQIPTRSDDASAGAAVHQLQEPMLPPSMPQLMNQQAFQAQMQQQQLLQQQMMSLRQEMQKQYEAAAQQQPFMMGQSPLYPGAPVGGQLLTLPGVSTELMELESKVKRLEIEKENLEAILAGNKKRFEEEMSAVEGSYRTRMQLTEESYQKREQRWKEEHELLLCQHLSRVRQIEVEKDALHSQNFQKLQDFDRDKVEEIMRLKDTQRKSLVELKQEYDEMFARLKEAQLQEIDAVTSAQSNSRSLHSAINRMHTSAKEFSEIQSKIDNWYKLGLDEREITMRTKDEQLNVIQEKLCRQQDENTKERGQLQELITRLEAELREQNRQMEAERWSVRQEQIRLQTIQSAVEKEKGIWIEQQARDKLSLEKSREKLLEEQRTLISLLHEERRVLAEERAEFNLIQKMVRERDHQSGIKTAQAEANYTVTMKVINEEKKASESRCRQIEKEEEQMASERKRLERDREAINLERDQLARRAADLKQQTQEVNATNAATSRHRKEAESAFVAAQKIDSEQDQKLASVQTQMQALRAKEKEITEEKLSLSKEKHELESIKTTMLCVNCRTPVRDTGLNGSVYQSEAVRNASMPRSWTHNINVLSQSVPVNQFVPSTKVPGEPLGNSVDAISASIAADRNVRMWKIQAYKDQEFLHDESMFLELLRHSPYHGTKAS